MQWSQRINELEGKGIRLVMVSIGKPQVGQELIQHLKLVENLGTDYLFVDPNNALYDALDLNRDVGRLFLNPATPFSFLDRFTKKDGTKELKQVLSNWSKAIYIPPKMEQSFLQGGTFIFNKDHTVFAHYDPSTAAHSSIDEVITIASSATAAVSKNSEQSEQSVIM